ncbi:MAG: hypothetical protein J0H02_08180 [Armatimonadetes bacterium]|nr:hypothetical protein [Armatimonadota bacterium]
MGEVDRIHPVTPAALQPHLGANVQMRKEGQHQQHEHERERSDVLELHTNEEEDATPLQEVHLTVDDEPEHGLDLTA